MICVQGLWHLGAVTAACLAEAGFDTVGLAEDEAAAAALSAGMAPIFEPGLAELMREGTASGKLAFTSDRSVVRQADLVWVTFDTPIDENDTADIEFVLQRVRALFPHLKNGAVVMLSSQLSVGSTARLVESFADIAAGRQVSFAYSPENLRLGQALDTFRKAERIVVGVADDVARSAIAPILGCFCPNILWMSVESAEMAKHALNTYLATCIVLTNEMAAISEKVGANFADVEKALRLDPRVGQRAYVRAGGAFGGGTLARDVLFLEGLARVSGVKVPLIGAIRDSNTNHADWVLRCLEERLSGLSGKRIGLLGLSYKPGTDSIRRSMAVGLGVAISGKGASVVAFDPKVRSLPSPIAAAIRVATAPEMVFADVDAVLVGTEWPEFRALPLSRLVDSMSGKLVVDQNGFLQGQFATMRGAVDYIVLGRAN